LTGKIVHEFTYSTDRHSAGASFDYGIRYQYRLTKENVRVLFSLVFIHPIDARRIRRAIARSDGPVRISLGSGEFVQPGWFGLDLKRAPSVFRADLRRRLPLATGSVDEILAEHVLEHLFVDQIPGLLSECYRLLKAGGVLRVVSPNGLLIADILSGRWGPSAKRQLSFEVALHKFERDDLLFLRAANRLTHQWGEHRSVLTPNGVETLLASTGFSGIRHLDIETSHYFRQTPGTHLARYPGSETEAFAIEAVH
jgi:SAM-dependent methyltransferase